MLIFGNSRSLAVMTRWWVSFTCFSHLTVEGYYMNVNVISVLVTRLYLGAPNIDGGRLNRFRELVAGAMGMDGLESDWRSRNFGIESS